MILRWSWIDKDDGPTVGVRWWRQQSYVDDDNEGLMLIENGITLAIMLVLMLAIKLVFV